MLCSNNKFNNISEISNKLRLMSWRKPAYKKGFFKKKRTGLTGFTGLKDKFLKSC
jgi:hypothetical protein